jgi:hypothetical protein
MSHLFVVDKNLNELTDAERRMLAGEFARWLGLGRSARLSQRDAAVRAALTSYGDMPPSAAAKRFACDLARYRVGGYWHECNVAELPEPASDLRRAMHRFLRRNNGKTLAWRQLLGIGEGRRGRPLRCP